MSLPLPSLHEPWWAPYADVAPRVIRAVEGGCTPRQALATIPSPVDLAAGPLRFVDGDSAPAGEAYEAFIARTACVPTRDNLHDLFNGLVWLRFARIKRRLNELQAAQIAQEGVQARRGPLRDALTLFDENGALLMAPPALWRALLARDWQRLFVAQRGLWRQARFVVFGHALLEKLATAPRKNLTAHVLLPPPDAAADEAEVAFDALAEGRALSADWLAGKPFTPLPVMGIPGWNAGNEDFSFYDDPEVFRPPRVR